MLTDTARAVLDGKAFAHVAVVDEQGQPHVSPMWVDVTEDGKVRINTAEGRVKSRLFQPGTVVALSATNPDNDYQHIMVRGPIVERTTEGADDVIDALAMKYLGKEKYPFRKEGEVRVTVVIDPQEVVG